MKKINLVRIMGVAITMVVMRISLSGAHGATVDPRAPLLWHATGGYVLKAEFLDLKEGVVILKDEEGQIRNVPLNLLLPEDQTVAKNLAERITSVEKLASKPGAKNLLSVFTEGPGKGFFAFYTSPNFIVRVSDKAVATITCLENGEPVGKPITIKSIYTYDDKKTGRPANRSIVSFDEAYAPVLQPSTLTLSGLLEDNVRFTFNLVINNNAIQTWGWVEDPPGIQVPTACNPTFLFAASNSFGPYVMVVDQKEAVKDLSLVANPVKGKPFTLQYGDVPKDYNVPLLSAEIKGPVFGARRVSVSINRSKEAEMLFVPTAHGPVYSGFEVTMYKKNNASRGDTVRLTLTID